MQHFSKLVTLLGVVAFCGLAQASESSAIHGEKKSNPLKQQPELLGVKKCLLKKFNSEKYDQAIAAGKSIDDAVIAAWTKSFDPTVFNQAVASGKNLEISMMLATEFDYVDQGVICDGLRKAIKDAVQKKLD